ncbi:hypothetical protein C8F04DRAFT_1303261 [Mycena alexandri]|uniref:Uncharacterized protein n=1 Tax=Mycena alexandri TaxID=1745969 RepID=A0AAD6SET7_9AGAR|nr:hypothetical protein C8F04DRAFT_1303261 [Mycena alexandri]
MSPPTSPPCVLLPFRSSTFLSRRPVQDFLDKVRQRRNRLQRRWSSSLLVLKPPQRRKLSQHCASPQALSIPQALTSMQYRKPSPQYRKRFPQARTTTLPSCGPVHVYMVYSAISGMKDGTSTTQWYEPELAMGTEGSENGPTWGMSPALTRSSKSCKR